MTLKQFLQMERKYRSSGKWWIGIFDVTNDHSVVVRVTIKSYGFYNQTLRINDNSINYCAGHTCKNVSEVHSHLTRVINLTDSCK